MVEDKEIRKKFDTALELFLDRVEVDTSILAIFVLGSYSNGLVWEKSDIDMVIVTNEERILQDLIIIHENDVQINAYIISRSDYRRNQQSFLHGSMMHHMLSTSKLVYSKEKGISDFNRDMFVAERDKELQIMMSCEFLVGCLHKLKKALYIEESLEKAFSWLVYATTNLSRILIFLESQIPGRDVITQAQEISDNPLINNIVTKVFKEGYNERNIENAIDMIENYLSENIRKFYKPLIEYLKKSLGERSHSEIDMYFRKATTLSDLTLVESIIWLADQGIVMTGVKPKRITARSRSTVDEVTVYYIGEDN